MVNEGDCKCKNCSKKDEQTWINGIYIDHYIIILYCD